MRNFGTVYLLCAGHLKSSSGCWDEKAVNPLEVGKGWPAFSWTRLVRSLICDCQAFRCPGACLLDIPEYYKTRVVKFLDRSFTPSLVTLNEGSVCNTAVSTNKVAVRSPLVQGSAKNIW